MDVRLKNHQKCKYMRKCFYLWNFEKKILYFMGPDDSRINKLIIASTHIHTHINIANT